MRYDEDYGADWPRGPRRAARLPRRREERAYDDAYHARRGHPRRRLPGSFDLHGPGYAGRGELGRYGTAPVPYGPEHTYDYHLGDHYGYGPDFRSGDARMRHHRRPRGDRRRGQPRRGGYGE